MGIFHSIKKSRRPSSDIDEKIEYLNKECKKTGLREAMSTANIYVNGGRVPNENFNNFNGLSHGGYGIGLSGGDGNGAGDASVGTITLDMNLGHAYPGMTGVALSPPHPVTGKRSYARTQTGFAGFFSPLRPGKVQTNSGVPSGGALWFFDPTYNFGGQQGRWLNFQWHPTQNAWAFWDTNFLGFFYLNTNLDDYEISGSNIGTQIKNTIASINFGNNGAVGEEQTLVLTKNNLDDPDFLPINIDGLSTQGFNYLKDKANVASNYYSVEDKKNVINYYKKLKADPNYQPKPFEIDSLMRQMRAQGDGVEIASTDPSAAFPSAPPPESSEPETVSVDSTKDAIPDAKDAKLGVWMSRQDFVQTYKGSSMVDYLDSLPYGATDFRKNITDKGWELDTDAYEKYFMTGDTSGLSVSKPRHKESSVVPSRTVAPVSASKGGGFLSLAADAVGRGAAKDVFDYYMDNVKKGTEGGEHDVSNLLGRSKRAVEKWYARNKTNLVNAEKTGKPIFKDAANYDFAHVSQTDGNLKNITGNLDFARGDGINDKGDTLEIIKHYDFDGERDLAGGGVVGNLGSKNYAKRQGIMDYLGDDGKGTSPLMKLVITIDKKTGTVKTSGGMKESLDESVKLGHFEPELLNVDINDIRKGIMPEFPKDPPPEMIDGYSVKSRLAPKKIEKDPFIKITKKDLAKNHRLKDSEIKDFMDQINSINEFIKKNPAELIYAQTRYPKDDPRLAQLNWQMDQMLDAGKEYMNKTFPENEKLFKKIQKTIKKNIELTDPKSFKDVKVPKYEGVNLTDYKRRKEVVSRHFKKAIKIERLFSNKKRRKNIKEEVESKKINIQEIMTTSNMYFSGEKVPNQDYNDFEGTSEGGYGLALSGADGNNVGNADVGSHVGQEGVALSPPHPVTGVRRAASHVRDGLGSTQPLRPGAVIKRGFADNAPDYTMGSALWFFDPDYNNGEGQWCNFEWGNFENNTGWGFWDTIKTGQFAGLYVFNRNLGEHPCAGGDLAGKIAGLNFSMNGAVGAPQTTVLFKKDLGDPDHLPINIPGLSPEAFNYLFAGANYDLYNWILKTYGMPAAEWYLKTGKSQGNPYLPGGAYVPRASNPNQPPSPFAGAQDGDQFAFFGGNKNNNKETPKKPTKKTRKGATDATAASTGMYPDMTPEIFQQKYGMTWQEYLNLP